MNESVISIRIPAGRQVYVDMGKFAVIFSRKDRLTEPFGTLLLVSYLHPSRRTNVKNSKAEKLIPTRIELDTFKGLAYGF